MDDTNFGESELYFLIKVEKNHLEESCVCHRDAGLGNLCPKEEAVSVAIELSKRYGSTCLYLVQRLGTTKSYPCVKAGGNWVVQGLIYNGDYKKVRNY